MKSLLTTFKKDMQLSMRGFYIYLMIFFAVIFIVIMLFVVTDETELSSPFAISVENKEELKEFESAIKSYGGDDLIIASSRKELVSILEEDHTMQGLYVSFIDDKINVEFIEQGYEDKSISNILKAEILGMAREEMGLGVNNEVTYLRQGIGKIPMKDAMIPIFLVMESALMGMFLVAAYVFMEKAEGTIRVFCVSPGKVWQFVASKTLVFLLFGIISAFLVVFILLGFNFNFIQVLLLLVAFNIFGTLLGLIMAVFFDSLQGAMVLIIAVAAVVGITTVSYINPSFSSTFIKLMPTYPMQFAFKEALFPTGDSAYVWKNILWFGGANIGLFIICNLLYKKRISAF